MAAVHFTTILCKPCVNHKIQGKPYIYIFFAIFVLELVRVNMGFGDVRTFLYGFMSVIVKVFVSLRITGKCIAIFSTAKD